MEIEHRVVNEYMQAIASILVAAARSSNAEAKAVLSNAAERLHDHAELHRTLQPPVLCGRIDLSEYLRGLCRALSRATLNERGIRLTLVEHLAMIEVEQCWRVGLIVFELVTNSFRHGFKYRTGKISVEIGRSQGQILCRVSDDGRPVRHPVPGRGTRIVDALAEELGGFVERQFGLDGTTVCLSFPEHAVVGRSRESGHTKNASFDVYAP
jgi:two-component sensor histidine kinase